jgi:hypothetical protein
MTGAKCQRHGAQKQARRRRSTSEPVANRRTWQSVDSDTILQDLRDRGATPEILTRNRKV